MCRIRVVDVVLCVGLRFNCVCLCVEMSLWVCLWWWWGGSGGGATVRDMYGGFECVCLAVCKVNRMSVDIYN